MAIELHTWLIEGITGLMLNNPALTLTGGGDEGLKAGKVAIRKRVLISTLRGDER